MKRLLRVAWLGGLTLFAAAGCESLRGGRSQAIAAALQEFQRRGGSGKVECEANKMGARWIVTIWRLPEAPGGFITVELSSDYRVLEVTTGN